jgi:hypothetical protein
MDEEKGACSLEEGETSQVLTSFSMWKSLSIAWLKEDFQCFVANVGPGILSTPTTATGAAVRCSENLLDVSISYLRSRGKMKRHSINNNVN